jgi:hypothetical protein
MNVMSAPHVEPADLLDLKLLPAWVKEPGATNHYEQYTPKADSDLRSHDRHGRPKDRRFRSGQGRGDKQGGKPGPDRRHDGRMSKRLADGPRHSDRGRSRRAPARIAQATPKPLDVTIRFLPRQSVFENVVAQIKSGSVAYSLFALARLFLEKPGRYEVRLTAKAETPFYELGEGGVVSVDREFLERNAFRFAQRDFYVVDVVENEPIKGNFSNVARCRLSGTLLGPTNYHTYQPQLRSLYEQRFSRRMSFADYQRQIEIVSDAVLVERWKDETRKVTTYTTLKEENPVTFPSAVEAERHFRSQYCPTLIRSMKDATIGGTSSRSLPDRILNRAIEQAWAHETRSPSNMMQELAGRFRESALNVFRHRRGMLFVSPIRVRAFVHAQAGVSPSVNAILEAVSATSPINRKQLLEKLIGNGASEEADPHRLALASDLRWLIDEGYVIEFNDGSLDLPRTKGGIREPLRTAEPASTFPADANRGPIEQLSAQAPLQLTWREP